MIVFSLDLGGALVGHARFSVERGTEPVLLEAGTWKIFDAKRTQSPGIRWLNLKMQLDNSLAFGERPDLVVYEEVSSHTSRTPGRAPSFNVAAAHAYGGAQAVLLAWCAGEGFEVKSQTIGSIKTAAVGKGGGPGSDKIAVLAAARARWPLCTDAVHFDGFDAADAAFIGLAALIELGLATPTPSSKVVTVKKPKKAKASEDAQGTTLFD